MTREQMKAATTPTLASVARMAVTELEARIGGHEGETLASIMRGHITALEHLVGPKRRRTL